MNEALEHAKKAIFLKRPILKEIIESNSNIVLSNYVQKNWQVGANLISDDFLSAIFEEALQIYGEDIANKTVQSIKKNRIVSTIDHLGIWGHPIFVNADLMYSLFFKPEDLGVVLATESVSLNNTSSWSGSFLVHNLGKLFRFSLFSDKSKTLPVFSAPLISEKQLFAFKKKTLERFNDLLDFLGFFNISNKKNFSQQAAFASFKFWQKVFPSAPKLVYIPLETVVSKFLIKEFLNVNSVFSKIILTSKGQVLWSKYFGNEHTFLFWSIDEKGRRKAISEIPKQTELLSLMEKRQVYPSSPLCFMVLLFAGLTCVGGFTQTTWLTEIKEKFLALLTELEDLQCAEKIALVPTKNFAESSIAWLQSEGGYFVPTGLDLYLGKFDIYLKFIQLAHKLTLKQSFELAIPEIYSVVLPKNEQVIMQEELVFNREKLLSEYLTSNNNLI